MEYKNNGGHGGTIQINCKIWILIFFFEAKESTVAFATTRLKNAHEQLRFALHSGHYTAQYPYHYKREEQHRLKQHLWFIYQLNLAWKMKLPVILHVRDAHEDALRILRWHPARKLGSVIHCFYGSKEITEQYLKLGYHFGIGGSVLQLEERAKDLWESIPHIPLDRILVETDAPYILPYCKDVLPPKLLRRSRNTSLILPAVIKKIAELKGVSPDEVERTTTENTIRLFKLPIDLQ